MKHPTEKTDSLEGQPGAHGDDPSQRVGILQEITASSTRIRPSYHPIFDKFESKHVTQFLTDTHQLRSTNRWFHLAYAIIGVSIFAFLSWFLLPEWPELYFDILMFLGVFAAGGAGGYGLKSWQSQRRS